MSELQGADQLTDIQRQFLTNFMSTGDIELALEMCRCEVTHFLAWRDNHPTFDSVYRSFLRQYTTFMREKMNLMAIQWAYNVLKNGCETVTNFKIVTKRNAEGEVIATESHKETKTLPVPAAAIKIAVSSNDVSEAILTMANEGVLPQSKVKRLLSAVDSITAEMQEAMSDGQQEDSMSTEAAVKLFKAALMKVS